jgi:hypothetical protein
MIHNAHILCDALAFRFLQEACALRVSITSRDRQ